MSKFDVLKPTDNLSVSLIIVTTVSTSALITTTYDSRQKLIEHQLAGLSFSELQHLKDNTIVELIRYKNAEPFLDKTISHGTLRTEHLIEAFLSYLIKLDWEGKFDSVIKEGKAFLASSYEDALSQDEDALMYLNEDLWDALNYYAPDGYRFAAHIGDGSDFGFWEIYQERNATRIYYRASYVK